MLFRSNISKKGIFAGGLVGEIHGGTTITQSSNNGNLIINAGVDAERIGGIVGYSSSATASITACVNRGKVTVIMPEDVASTHDSKIGGIIGESYITIENTYNLGDVEVSANGGLLYVGGIVGYSTSNSVTRNCYNVGVVKGASAGSIIGYVGSSATVEDCYWNIDSAQYLGTISIPDGSKKGIANGTGNVTELTTYQMKQQASYAGFDFSEVWEMVSNKNDGYPSLRETVALYTLSFLSSYNHEGEPTGAGSYEKGAKVTVVAPKPLIGYVFKEWVVTDIALDDLTQPTLSFNMPARNITFKPTYSSISKCAISVTDGRINKASAWEGEEVTVSAYTGADRTFDRWVATGITLTSEQEKSSTLTFTMPGNAVSFTGVYIDIPMYSISVSYGTKNLSTASEGTAVVIKATVPRGKTFDKWIATGITLTPDQEISTTLNIIMPANDIALTATFQSTTAASASPSRSEERRVGKEC